MCLIKRLLISTGLILTGLIISSTDLHPNLYPLQVYQREIFYTNCRILFTNEEITADAPLPSMPAECATIEWALPSGLIASGIITLIFGLNKTSCFLSAANLIGYLAMYLNTGIDSSFGVYSHAIEVLAIAFGLIFALLRQNDQKISDR